MCYACTAAFVRWAQSAREAHSTFQSAPSLGRVTGNCAVPKLVELCVASGTYFRRLAPRFNSRSKMSTEGSETLAL